MSKSSKPAILWRGGRKFPITINKIYNEDCLVGMKRIPDGSVDMILCDLPYGTTQCKWDAVIPFDKLWEQYERVIKPNGAIVLTSAQPFTSFLITSNPKLFKYEWIWEKTISSGQLNVSHQPLRAHESVLVFYAKKPTYNEQLVSGEPYSVKRKVNFEGPGYGAQLESSKENTGYRHARTVLKVPNPRIKGGHPTQKPAALFEYLIKTYTNPGETVLDNCIGSGTTAVAALNTGRKFIGFEKDPKYHASAAARVESITLNQARQVNNPSLLWRGGKKFPINTKSRDLDQFYTQPRVAQQCMDYLATVMALTDSDLYLEPSAGKGAFYDLAPSSRRVGLDMDPQHADVIKQDYLTYDASNLKCDGKFIVIGNPPFGKNSSLAVKFFNKSAEFADCIAFILPRTFKKVSLLPKLDKHFHLIGELDLPWDSFEYDGMPYSVPCVFQVWQKSSTERVDAKPALTHSDFKFVTSTDSADFAVRRIGALAGKVIVDYEGYSPSSHYYIKTNKPIADTLNAFANMDWDSVRFDTAGAPSISKAELVALYAQSTKLN